jgi:hypothetical protein
MSAARRNRSVKFGSNRIDEIAPSHCRPWQKTTLKSNKA